MKNINEKLETLSDSFKSNLNENLRKSILYNLWFSLSDPLVVGLEAAFVDNIKQKEIVNEEHK